MKPKSNDRTPIRDLSCACVDAKPRTVVDWGWREHQVESSTYDYDDTGNGWRAWSAEECEACHELVVLGVSEGDDEHHRLTSTQCQGHVPLFEGPMMNYFYPLGPERDGWDDPEEMARRIAGLPLCIVRLDGEMGLALTGGGMDLSWEICEAYTRLGCLPPTHFEPPAMSGRGTSDRDRYLVAAYRRACMVQTGWLRTKMRAARALTKPLPTPPAPKLRARARVRRSA